MGKHILEKTEEVQCNIVPAGLKLGYTQFL